MKEINKELTIVIVTYNSAEIISSCLSNLDFSKNDVIVVDNASSDETTQIVENNFPQVKLIKLQKNLGYGRGNNVALKQITGQFALILNPDAVIQQKDIDIILSTIKQDNSIAMAGPLIFKGNKLQAEELQKKLDEIENDLQGARYNYYQRINNYLVVRFALGAVAVVRLEILKKIGFYDENIFLYYEDDELCKRIIKNGYKNAVIPEAHAFHLEGKSSKFTYRGLYKKYWHLTWSKLYWKGLNKGVFSSKKLAFRNIIGYFLKALFFLIILDFKNFLANFGSFVGSISFFIGLKAFDKNNNARG